MWKKIQCAVIACLLCVACAATASAAVRSDDVRRAEKPERIDTIGGFNSMIEKQKALSTPVDVTAVLFNDTTDVLYTHKNIRLVRPLTDKEYEVGGTTALLDAVGNTILKVEREPSVKSRGTKVVFVIITDGLENASAEFSKTKVKQMISDKQEKADWDFIYLGANIDAVEEADAIGVKKSNAVTYKNTRKGVRANYDAVSAFVAETAERGDADTSGEWRSYVEEDTTK